MANTPVSEWSIDGKKTDADNQRVSRVRITQSNMATDKCTFVAEGRDMDESLFFDAGEQVIVRGPGGIWFQGQATYPSRNGGQSAESHGYELLSVWDQLERHVFQQARTAGEWVADAYVLRTVYTSRVILGQTVAGAVQPLGDTIAEIIDYAAASGLPIQRGTIDAGYIVPLDEAIDIFCAEAIRKVSMYAPGAIGWLDYSTVPPRFNWRFRDNLSTVSVNVEDTFDESISKVKRSRVPAVVLKYEKTVSIDDSSALAIVLDSYPTNATGREPCAIVQTIPLEGAALTVQRQHILVEPLPLTGAGWMAWWLEHYPALADPSVTYLVIEGQERLYSLANELIEGTIQDWMIDTGVQAAEDMITATARYEVATDGGLTIPVKVAISATIRVTNASTRWYSRTSGTLGSEAPAGLAQALYNALNTDFYAGTVGTRGRECDRALCMGKRLNISGGASEWTSMRAIIQSVSYDIDAGRTVLQLGVPNHLTPRDAILLLRANRCRKVAVSASGRLSGAASSNTIDLGSAHPLGGASGAVKSTGTLRDIVLDVRYDPSTKQFQKKQVKAILLSAEEAPETWTMVEGGQAGPCPTPTPT